MPNTHSNTQTVRIFIYSVCIFDLWKELQAAFYSICKHMKDSTLRYLYIDMKQVLSLSETQLDRIDRSKCHFLNLLFTLSSFP